MAKKNDDIECKGVFFSMFFVFVIVTHMIFDVPRFILSGAEFVMVFVSAFVVTIVISFLMRKNRRCAASFFVIHHVAPHDRRRNIDHVVEEKDKMI